MLLFLMLPTRPRAAPERDRLIATYSIVARDSRTGELGVAAQSHYFATGADVPWAEAGVGAVATQAFVEPSYGPNGLQLLREGKSAPEALETLLAADAGREVRQVAIVDAMGRVAVHTGRNCIKVAGDETGVGYSVQGNMLRDERVWKAMPAAFESAQGHLADRLLAALEAAERGGGDVRGRQSATLLVVSGKPAARHAAETRIDLRVDDHPRPLEELGRLLTVYRAYERMEEGHAAAAAGKLDQASKLFAEAQDAYPENPEFSFWAGIALANRGKLDEALRFLRFAYARDPGWKELVRRLPQSGLLPDDDALLERITRD
jgi:uncharacterized Ntn-hydrolase superfamily protein